MEKSLIVFIIISLFSGNSDAQSKWKKGVVSISGKVINFDKHKDNHTIQFDFQDLFQRKSKGPLNADIDSTGHFSITVGIWYPQDFDIIYGRRARLLCAPGDSLFVEIDADIFNDFRNLTPNNEYFVRVTGGNRAKDNADLVAFMNGELATVYDGKTISEAITTKSANEFKIYNSNREKEYRAFLNDFKKQNETSDAFNNWIDDYLKYQTLDDLFGYPFEHSRNNKISEDSLKLPADYYDFLQNYPMNDSQIISSKHAYVIQSYSRFILENKKDSVGNVCKLMKSKGIIDASEIELLRIRRETSGFTQNIVLTNYYLKLIGAQLLKEFKAVYDSSYITEPYFRGIIREELQNLQKFMDIQIANGSSLKSISSSDDNNLIRTICTKYSGKVIYIDFWATWCSPCMAEMPYSKELQEKYKDKDVVFLFLANRCSEDAWKATIVNKNMTGEQMLLTEKQFASLADKFGIKGIPHYVLIDRNGKLISKNAARPSEKALITNQINQLLENKK